MKSLTDAAQRERPILLAIVRVGNEKALTDLVARQPVTSRIGQMIYAAKLYQFDKEKGGLAVLRALPKSAVEMEALLEFSDRRFFSIYHEFYKAAFRSVIVHPEFLHSVFKAVLIGSGQDYDHSDWFCGQLAVIHRAIPREYDRAEASGTRAERLDAKFCSNYKLYPYTEF